MVAALTRVMVEVDFEYRASVELVDRPVGAGVIAGAKDQDLGHAGVELRSRGYR
jgi:hypothetical protein